MPRTGAIVCLTCAAFLVWLLPASTANASCTTTVSPGVDLQATLDAANAGDTICLHGGSYPGDVAIRRSGTSSAPITVQSYPGEIAELIGAASLNPTYQPVIGAD